MSTYDLASLGTATGTRVDSPAKHIMACKMDTNYLINLLQKQGSDPYTTLHQNKLKWCMHKDEVVLFTGKKLITGTSSVSSKAYPMVITTVGDMLDKTKQFLIKLYDTDTSFGFHLIISQLQKANWEKERDFCSKIFGEACDEDKLQKLFEAGKLKTQIMQTPDFRCQGIALGQAFASYMSGDTVASVLVGGVQTVQNGAFPMQTGDLVQWYFDFEESKFETANAAKQGQRVDGNSAKNGALGKRQ